MSRGQQARGEEKRQNPRAPLRTRVEISYPDPQRFVANVCQNVSVTGMFVEAELVPPLGTMIDFELDLAHLGGLVRGVGEVVWAKTSWDTRGGPGFGMRFVEIDPSHLQLIFRVVDRFVANGGDPFDLDRPSSGGSS